MRNCFIFFKGFLIIALLFLSVFIHAQDKNKLISGSYDHVSVTQFLHNIEDNSGYYFYYDSTQVDSIRITISFKNEALPNLLSLAFKGTDLQFAIDNENHVFITRKIPVVTALPKGFYNPSQPASIEQTNLEIIKETGNKKSKMPEENRLYEIGRKTNSLKQTNTIISGYIKDSKSGEPIANAIIFDEKLQKGSTTDQYGYYSITLPSGNHTLLVQGIGMKDAHYQLLIYSDGRLDLELNEQVNTLKEVIVSARQMANINRVQMGVEHLTISTIKQMPAVFGEADVLRAVLTLPGVKTVGEASTGFNVRGGSADQNLILLNGATIYNPSHFFGLFSAFNPEIIKSIELYKSSIPARFGGRLSSVLDVETREGNSKKITGSAGIGLITSRFNIEGPIGNEKTTFLLGARTTYADWILANLPNPYNHSKAAFNDFNLGITSHLNKKNDLYVSGYLSNDQFNLTTDTTYKYSNKSLSLKWKHSFNNKFNVIFSTGYDQYKYSITSQKQTTNDYILNFDIAQSNFKSDFNYYINSKHSLNFGIQSIYYTLHPGSYLPVGPKSLVKFDNIPTEQAIESAAYIEDKYTISDNLSANIGIRYSIYNYLGPGDIHNYAIGQPKDETTLTSSTHYDKGKIIGTYQTPEYRASLRYAINPTFSIKAGYNSNEQYIHTISNTTAIAPTDIYKLSDPNIKPQHGDQISLGFYKNLKSNTIETSLEVYYKKIDNYLDYKPGATLVMNHFIETDVISTKGKAYGIELLVKKEVGKLNGWISYTYSRILLKMDDPSISTPVNHGNFYPANYDIPHDFVAVANFKVNHRFSVSMNVNYNTGRPITLPIGRYYYAGSQRVLYSDRNAYRIPDYFRTDLSMNIDGNHKVKQKTHNSWTIGVYNLTGRKNPYSVYFVSENGLVNGYKLSIFGTVIPFINFNIRF